MTSQKVLISFLLFSYSVSFFLRRSERFIAKGVQKDLDLDIRSIGIISSFLNFGYLIGKFSGGFISDYAKPKIVFQIALFIASVFSLAVVVSSNFFMLTISFALVGISTGFTWPAVIKILRCGLPQSALGSAWSMFSASHGVIGVIAPAVISYYGSNWQQMMITVSSIGLGSSVLCAMLIDEGDPKPAKQSGVTQQKENKETPKRSRRFMAVVVIFSIAGFMNRLSRFSADWFTIVDDEVFTPYVVSLQQTGCLIGCLTSGFLADFIVRKSSSPSSNPRIPLFIFLVITSSLAHFLLVSGGFNVLLVNILYGLSIDSAYNIGGVVQTELVSPAEAGSVNSWISLACSFGMFCAGYPVAAFAENYGWVVTHQLMAVFISLSVLPIFFIPQSEKAKSD